jgi:alanine racemase
MSDPAWLEVDLDKVVGNIQKLKALAGAGVKVLAMVKAQGYGCGAEMISRVALESGVDMLGVATVSEGLSLRQRGLECPILNFGRPEESELESVVRMDFLQTVFQPSLIRQLDSIARKQGKKQKVHLNLDTGMGRLGLRPEGLDDYLDCLATCSNVLLDGVFTHFAVADTDRAFTQAQIELFKSLVEKIRKRGFPIRLVHVANSAALLNRWCDPFEMVRPGISLYGLYGSARISRETELEETVSFKTRVVHTKRIPAGATVSYGRRYTAEKETTIATVSAGYADGVPFNLAKKGDVLIRGRRFPMVGRVTMDMTMVDLGDASDIAIGEEVVIIGRSGQERISVGEVAEKIGAIEHAVLCGIGPRVARVYLRGGRIVSEQRYTLS